jgi:beta-ureidopropionase / N-carbamoyl-L-amino-acid hydrolase
VGELDVAALLGEIAGIGRDARRGGYSRHVFDEHEARLRAWFTGHAARLGLTVAPDGNGNLWAWWGDPGPGAVLTGSHLDSVPGGGAYDGPLGVASALAAVSRLRAARERPPRPLAVVAFAEEEGSRFGRACLGSRLAAGQADPAAVREYRDAVGVTFADAARAAGIDPAGIGPVPWAARAACFVELHVEQGRALADLGQPVAIATTILAHGRWALAFTGQGNHAGTTAMAGRRDPAAAAARTVLAARDLALAADPAPGDNSKMRGRAVPGRAVAARATVGQAEFIPGGTNVIASRVTLSLDCRAGDDASLEALVAAIAGAAEQAATAEGCTVTMSRASLSPLVVFDAALRDTIAALLPGAPLLATGAGHDAGVLAALIPTAMLFVRNPSGVSHAPGEGASDDDCRAGVGALTTVLRHLLSGGRAGPRQAAPR